MAVKQTAGRDQLGAFVQNSAELKWMMYYSGYKSGVEDKLSF